MTGFTLVELIMVLILLGILSLFVIPRFFDRGTFDARSLGDEAQGMMRYAQKLAVARNSNIYICVGSNEIKLGIQNNCDPAVLMSSGKPATLSHSDVSISPVMSFYFDGLGKPFNTASTADLATTQFNLTIGGVTQSFYIEKETGYVHQ
ncbi:MAG TPA: prepilin-type N-terminal cleavage/methylation domain-containing protein [Oxalicibacterium sp.]